MRQAASILVAAAVLAAVSAAWAEVGDLKYLDASPKGDQVMEGGALQAMSHSIGTAGESSGVTSSKAVAGNFLLGGRNIAAAIDAKAADAKRPDVIRFDLSGEGKFTDANTFPLRLRKGMPKDMTMLEFGPALLKISEENREIPLVVTGTLMRTGQRELWMGKAKTFDVGAGQTVEVAVGSPLKAAVKAAVKGRSVAFTLAVTDASGTAVDYATGAEGARLPEPKLLVSDADGKEVYRCTLEYG